MSLYTGADRQTAVNNAITGEAWGTLKKGYYIEDYPDHADLRDDAKWGAVLKFADDSIHTVNGNVVGDPPTSYTVETLDSATYSSLDPDTFPATS